MQCYRLEREGRGRGGRLSQSSLLTLMGKFKDEYANYSHSTVGRWESGETLPTRERLEIFGAALDLPRAEIDGLIALPGLGEEHLAFVETAATRAGNAEAASPALSAMADGKAGYMSEGRSYTGEVVRFVLAKFLLPGLTIAGAGCLLALVGWNADWMLSAYIIVVICAVLSHYFLRLRQSSGLRGLSLRIDFRSAQHPHVAGPLDANGSFWVLCG